jgi:hypothetical protein
MFARQKGRLPHFDRGATAFYSSGAEFGNVVNFTEIFMTSDSNPNYISRANKKIFSGRFPDITDFDFRFAFESDVIAPSRSCSNVGRKFQCWLPDRQIWLKFRFGGTLSCSKSLASEPACFSGFVEAVAKKQKPENTNSDTKKSEISRRPLRSKIAPLHTRIMMLLGLLSVIPAYAIYGRRRDADILWEALLVVSIVGSAVMIYTWTL